MSHRRRETENPLFFKQQMRPEPEIDVLPPPASENFYYENS
jgi:hypothetical protein